MTLAIQSSISLTIRERYQKYNSQSVKIVENTYNWGLELGASLGVGVRIVIWVMLAGYILTIGSLLGVLLGWLSTCVLFWVLFSVSSVEGDKIEKWKKYFKLKSLQTFLKYQFAQN